ncbi:MAG: FAD-dependent oxidoreductase [Chloroflexi bacterium]|nr:MAG: FAD-dependent oxidoreductase [Chloroflexota bacterium]
MNTRTEPVPGHQISVEVQRRLEVDGVLPAKVMRPTDAEDAARGLRLCDLTPAAVVVWGGGTQMRLGTPPRRYDVALSTERMTQVLEYEPADLTCRLQAGITVTRDAGRRRGGEPQGPGPAAGQRDRARPLRSVESRHRSGRQAEPPVSCPGGRHRARPQRPMGLRSDGRLELDAGLEAGRLRSGSRRRQRSRGALDPRGRWPGRRPGHSLILLGRGARLVGSG